MYRALFFLLGESLDILSEDINLVSNMSPTDRDILSQSLLVHDLNFGFS